MPDDHDLVVRFWKPYGVLSSFTDREGRETLADHIDIHDVYPAGRLDRDSEGLLLLPRSPALRGSLTAGDHPRGYLVLVEHDPDDEALAALVGGVELRDGSARAIAAELLDEPPDLPDRRVPVRTRRTVTDRWMRLTLGEGRNRQVRRMTAAVGHPTLRLVRESIGPVSLDGLAPGEWQALGPHEREALTEAVESTSRRARDRRRRGPRSPG